jgi:DNA polymerase-1
MYRVIDVSSILFRFFFAIPEKFSANGLMINGLFGFCRFLNKILSEESKVILCLDKCKNNFRKELNPNYKQNRKKLDSSLFEQLNLLEEICEKSGITVLYSDEFEADDLIGSITHQIEGKHMIYSTDKDFMQLCNDNVHVCNPFTKEIFDSQKIFIKYGIFPKDFALYLAMMGDKSDNIKGVMGVGPKFAQKIILEGMEKYKNQFDFSDLPLNLELTTIKKNIFIDKNKFRNFSNEEWKKNIKFLGF